MKTNVQNVWIAPIIAPCMLYNRINERFLYTTPKKRKDNSDSKCDKTLSPNHNCRFLRSPIVKISPMPAPYAVLIQGLLVIGHAPELHPTK
jgi:hypothetical protein